MGIFKKIWNWIFGNDEVESYEDYKAKCLKDAPPPQNPTRDFKREADEHFRQQQIRRDSDDNFLTGAMVGYLFADSLNDNNSHRDVEETKSSNYESRYTPSSSSSYDSGSYSSSYDSGSSSSSCDSGC